MAENKKLKTLTLPSADGSSVTFDLYPNWENIENKPETFGVGQFGTGENSEIFNDYINNIASGDYSHAEGLGTFAYGDYQHVQGKYNIQDDDNTYAHIVGNGDSNTTRSNAHTLDWSGNAWYAGSVTATHMVLGAAGYGTALPATGVEGQIFFLIGGNVATDDGNGIITLG